MKYKKKKTNKKTIIAAVFVGICKAKTNFRLKIIKIMSACTCTFLSILLINL